MKRESVRQASGDDFERLGERLKELRNQRRVSQSELAKTLKIGQTALSHAETRSDMKLSTLVEYIRALGGRIDLAAIFDDLGRQSLLSERTSAPRADDPQLTLPGFESRVPAGGRDVVLSIRPRYAERIFDGTKTVELRRRFSEAVPSGALACIYSTTPTKAMTGAATIEDVQRLSIATLWRRHKEAAAIKRADFDAYFEGVDSGYAILLSSAREFERAIPLTELRSLCDFEPPQSYLYATPQLSKLIHGEWAEALN